MPHRTKHTPKVSTRSVKPYACESSREKRQQDRQTARQTDRRTDSQTDRQTHRRTVQNHFSRRFGGCTLYIPNPVLSRSRFFARCQYFHWHGSNNENNQILVFKTGCRNISCKGLFRRGWHFCRSIFESNESKTMYPKIYVIFISHQCPLVKLTFFFIVVSLLIGIINVGQFLQVSMSSSVSNKDNILNCWTCWSR